MNKLVFTLGIFILVSVMAADMTNYTPPIATEYISTLNQLKAIEDKIDKIDTRVTDIYGFSTRLSGLDTEIQAKIQDFYIKIESVVKEIRDNMLLFAVILVGILLLGAGSLALILYFTVQKAFEHYTRMELEPAIFRVLNSNYYTVNKDVTQNTLTKVVEESKIKAEVVNEKTKEPVSKVKLDKILSKPSEVKMSKATQAAIKKQLSKQSKQVHKDPLESIRLPDPVSMDDEGGEFNSEDDTPELDVIEPVNTSDLPVKEQPKSETINLPKKKKWGIF